MNSLPEIDDLLCRVLRGESLAWPPDCDGDFEQAFLNRSIYHGVQLLIFDTVNNTAEWSDWPASVRQRLTTENRAAVAHEMLRSHCLSSFLEELRKRKILALVTKGEALGRMFYARPCLRARCDTDIFIDLEDIQRVRTVLLDLGYKVIPPVYKSHQFSGVRGFAGTAISFDVHWRILNAPKFARAIRFSEALEHSVPIPGLPEARTLNARDALMLACMHRDGSHSAERGRLIWVYDIHLLASTLTAEQWKCFVEKVVGLGVQGACLSGLEGARQGFMTQVPDDVLRTLGQAPAETLYRRFAGSNLSLLLDDLRSLPDGRARRGLIAELFFPSTDLLLKRYHKNNFLWLPLLYLHQVLGGMMKRMSLR